MRSQERSCFSPPMTRVMSQGPSCSSTVVSHRCSLVKTFARKETSMKVALVGATGNVGTRLISELKRRGHHVTAIARHPERLQGQASLSPVSGDAQNENALAAVLAGHNVVIPSVKFLSTNASKIIAATKA